MQGKAPGQLAAGDDDRPGRRIVVRLRSERAAWSDGSRSVDSVDVERALTNAAEPTSPRYSARWADLLDRVDVPDATHVEIRLTRSLPPARRLAPRAGRPRARRGRRPLDRGRPRPGTHRRRPLPLRRHRPRPLRAGRGRFNERRRRAARGRPAGQGVPPRERLTDPRRLARGARSGCSNTSRPTASPGSPPTPRSRSAATPGRVSTGSPSTAGALRSGTGTSAAASRRRSTAGRSSKRRSSVARPTR